MIKTADLHDAGRQISGWYGGLDQNVKRTLMQGLVGAGAGGALMGGLEAASPHDKERKHPVVSSALMGALLGGTATAGLGYGMRTLGSGISFGGTQHRPLGAQASDKVVGTGLKHPALLAGGLWAGLNGKNMEAITQLKDTVKGQEPGTKALGLAQRLKAALGTMGEKAVEYRKASPKARVDMPFRAHPKRLAAIPAALGAGWLADKYIRGDY
jgi:hypothetical protein